MASLYERLAGVHATRPKIPVHQFQALYSENARLTIDNTQANAILSSFSGGVGLDATEALELGDLVATVPTGQTTANQAARAQRMIEIDQVLLLAEHTMPLALAPLATAAAVRTRLGVQTR